MKRKEKIIKNFVRVVLMVSLCLGMMLLPGERVWAEGTDYGTQIATGSCGATENDSVTWTVYDSGGDGDESTETGDTLVLSGSGKMADFQSYNVPWSSYRSYITNVIFTEVSEITSIGNNVFYYFTNLTEINIPDGVTSIGDSAFYGCKNISSIDIPENVTYIGEGAFGNCSQLKFQVAATNNYLCSEDGALYNKDKTTLISYPAASGEVVISETVTRIAPYAFQGCTGLTEINIPDGVTKIETMTFYGCTNLENITLSKNLTIVGEYAFCNCKKLTGIDIPEGVTDIGEYAFEFCSSLKDINIPEKLTTINTQTFSGCAFTSLTIPEGVTVIGRSAFSDCSELTDISIPKSVISIGGLAFYNCKKLNTITIPEGVTKIETMTFYGCTNLTSVTMPKKLTGSIGGLAFYNCEKLNTITIPEGVTKIEECAFSGCTNLASVTMPESLTTIERFAFAYCGGLTNVNIPKGVTRIGEDAFLCCDNLSSINIPEGITRIEDETFRNCSSLTGLVIPENVKYIGTNALYNCTSMTEIYYPSGLETVVNAAGISTSTLQGSYTVNKDNTNTVSLTIQHISTETTSITLPDEIYGKAISSITYAEGVDSSNVSINCTKHFPNEWKYDKENHWNADGKCTLCEQELAENESEKEAHNFGNGTQPCKCGYIPFAMETQPSGGNLVYGYEKGTELSVSVTVKLGTEDIKYQWYENNEEIQGATENTYVVPTGKNALDYEYYCKISCGTYNLNSDTVSVSVAKAQGMINVEEGKEEVSLNYSKNPVSLDWVTKTGDGTLVYTVTDGNNVMSVSEDGKVTMTKLGTASISISMAETENFIEAETKNITVMIKADYPATTPDTPMAVVNTVKKVSEVTLPTDWQWDSEDTEKTLPEGKELEVMANYTGEDKEFYNKISLKVTIQRAACTRSEVLYTGEGEKAPTCTTEGKGHKECTVCGDILESDITVPVLKHTLSKVSKVETTCTTAGKEQHWKCIECNKLFSDEEGTKEVADEATLIIPVTAHTGGTATCTKEAVCDVCHGAYGELDKTNHGETELKNAKEATCKEVGHTGDTYCKDCGKKISSGKEIEALGHNLVKVSKVEATCTTSGNYEYWICSECDEVYGDEAGTKGIANKEDLIIPAKGHSGGTADCSHRAVCGTCRQEYGELDKTKHGETELKDAKEATCKEAGYTGDVYCKECGEKISSGEEISKVAHKLSKVERVEATCTTAGKEAYYSCSECKKIFSDEQGTKEVTEESLIIPATGHSGGTADCTKKAVCDVCHETYGELDKTNHGETEIKNAKEATCKEEGFSGDMYCKDCGEKISSGEKKAKLNHTWDEGIVTKEATETQKGIKTYTCSVCQQIKTEEIPALEKDKVTTPEIPKEDITPEKPETEATLTPTSKPTQGASEGDKKPTPLPTQGASEGDKEPTPLPTQGASKGDTKVAPKKGTILIDEKNQVKYKILVSDTKNGIVEYIKPLNKKAKKANVPATVKINGITYKVVSIGKNAFKNHKYITKITIGKNVKTIGANAFYGCKKLKTVFMGKNVTTIGNKAFYKCTALTKITIPSKVKKIGKQAFYGCKKLKTVTIKTTKLTQKNVGSKAFTGIYKKATIKVPKSKVSAYQKMLKTKGVSKTVKVKK